MTERQLLTLGLAVLLAVRLGAILFVDSPIAPDGSAYQDLAVRVMDEGFFFANRPTGYPFLLAQSYQLFWATTTLRTSSSIWHLLWLAAGCSSISFGHWPAGRRPSSPWIAYAILPGLLLLTPVRLTDTVFATLAIAVCWAGSRMSGGSMVWG